MTVAEPLHVEASSYLEIKPSVQPAKEAARELIHDLRQPLSSIEAIAYYLEMTLPPDQFEARLYMRRLQQLVDQTHGILDRASSTARKHAASASSL